MCSLKLTKIHSNSSGIWNISVLTYYLSMCVLDRIICDITTMLEDKPWSIGNLEECRHNFSNALKDLFRNRHVDVNCISLCKFKKIEPEV